MFTYNVSMLLRGKVEERTLTLMNKDIELFDVKISKYCHIEEILNIREQNSNLFPYALPLNLLHPTQVEEWVRYRGISKARVRNHIPKEYKSRYVLALSLLGNSFSLCDQYWFRSDSSQKWEDLNYFTNDFTDRTNEYLLKGDLPSGEDERSPSNNLGGTTPKRWVMENGKRVLQKESTFRHPSRGARELFANSLFNLVLDEKEVVQYSVREEITKKVDFGIIMQGRKEITSCENFVTPDTELVLFNEILLNRNLSWEQVTYPMLKEVYGEHCYILDWMLMMDRILLNVERHTSHFGFIRDSSTGELLRPAPIYGTSHILYPYTDGNHPLDVSQHNESKPFRGNWNVAHKNIDFAKYTEGLLAIKANYKDLFHFAFNNSTEYNDLTYGKRWQEQILYLLKYNIDKLLHKAQRNPLIWLN